MRHKYIVTSEQPRIINGMKLKKGDVFLLDGSDNKSTHFELLEEKKEPKKEIKKKTEVKDEPKK